MIEFCREDFPYSKNPIMDIQFFGAFPKFKRLESYLTLWASKRFNNIMMFSILLTYWLLDEDSKSYAPSNFSLGSCTQLGTAT